MLKWLERIIVTNKYSQLRQIEFNKFVEKYVRKLDAGLDAEQYKMYKDKISTCPSCGSVDKKKKHYIGKNIFREKEYQLICLRCQNVEDHPSLFYYSYNSKDLIRNINQIVKTNYTFAQSGLREMRAEFIARRFEYELIQSYLGIGLDSFKWYRHSIKKISTEDMNIYIKEKEKEQHDNNK